MGFPCVRLFLGFTHSGLLRGKVGHLLMEVRKKETVNQNGVKLGTWAEGDCLTF
jgi:hypothetical protein